MSVTPGGTVCEKPSLLDRSVDAVNKGWNSHEVIAGATARGQGSMFGTNGRTISR